LTLAEPDAGFYSALRIDLPNLRAFTIEKINFSVMRK
jgi:hypothetical protein